MLRLATDGQYWEGNHRLSEITVVIWGNFPVSVKVIPNHSHNQSYSKLKQIATCPLSFPAF